MADESLGHIEIRFPEGSGSDSPTQDNSDIILVLRELIATLKKDIVETQKEITEDKKNATDKKGEEKKEKSTLEKLKGGFESLKSVYGKVQNAGSVGEGVKAVKGGISELAPILETLGLVGTAALAVAAVVVIIIAVIAIIVMTVKWIAQKVQEGIQEVLSSIDRLSNVNGQMAMEKALNSLQQMQMDIKEAQLIGPLYADIAQLWRKFQAELFPFIIIFKLFLFGMLKGVLYLIVALLEVIRMIINGVLQMLIGFTSFMMGGGNIASKAGGLLSTPAMNFATGGISGIFGWLLQAGGNETVKQFKALNKILTSIYNLINGAIPNKGAHPNDFFTRQLEEMSHKGQQYNPKPYIPFR